MSDEASTPLSIPSTTADTPEPELPAADIRRQQQLGKMLLDRTFWAIWWLPIVCLLLAAGLIASSLRTRGPRLTIHFAEGHGLKAGDAVRYRGIDVGAVIDLRLNGRADGVDVSLRLESNSRQLAREGARFWIERPRFSLSRISGLETVVGAKYVSVLPGPESGRTVYEFDGLETPAAAEERLEGGLEIVLESPHRHGLEIGAPISYRGLAIGHVIAVGFAPDASVVEARVYVQPSYKNLVRDNSRFWSMSGFDLDVGLTGVRLTAETLATIAAGGVAVATPSNPGKPVATGHRFPLHDKADDNWSTWQPRIALGNPAAPHVSPLPQLLRASLRWTEKKFGFTRQRQREGWVLPLDDDRLLGPADLLTIPAQALEQSATLELNGRELPLSPHSSQTFGDLSLLPIPKELTNSSPRWPGARLRVARQPEDGVLVPGWQEPSTVLAATHLKPADGSWLIAAHMPIPTDLHGAAVVSSVDGKLVGIVFAEKGRARVALLSEQAVK